MLPCSSPGISTLLVTKTTQDTGAYIQKYPNILGEDVAGEVVEVGDGVTRLSEAQRVIG
jgi:NADPH:quinone reductase-like Zn-dependent oxidoreductase